MNEKERGDDLVRSLAKFLTPQNREEFYKEGFRLYEQAVAGDRAAAKKALELWREAYENDHEDSVAQAYCGISMVLAGRDSSDLGKLLTDTITGLIHLNRAIERDPDNPHIRVLVAYLSHSMPEAMFHKHKKDAKDSESPKEAPGQEKSMFPQEYRELFNDVGKLYFIGKKVISELKGLKDMVTGRKS